MWTAGQARIEGQGRTRSAGYSGAMTALAVVLAVGACSTVEDSWDYVFGDDVAPAVATTAEGNATQDGPAAPEAPIPEGLRGDPQPPEYAPGSRRQPTSTRALNDEGEVPAARQTVVESATPAATPAPAPVQRAPLAPPPAPVQAAAVPPASAPQPPAVQHQVLPPAAPSGEVFANQPLVAAVPPPRLTPPPAQTAAAPMQLRIPPAAPTDQLLISPIGGAGGGGDLGTTVIGGDGRVLSRPDEMLAHPTLTPDSFGFDGDAAAMPMMMTGAETLLATIQFGHGSANLSERERRLLRQVVEMQRQNGGVLQVVGHASSRTADMDMDRHMTVNYVTSVQRAEAVARELRRLGAPAGAVLVVAQSDNQPIYREVMPSGEAGNRRAEVYLLN